MNIQIIGTGITKFGELWTKSLPDLIAEASLEAVKDADIEAKSIDAVIVSNMLSGVITGQDHLGALTTSILSSNAPASRVEAACASGGIAIHQAAQAILSGMYRTVLVVGAEKMTDVSPKKITTALMGAGSEDERLAGLTFPGLYALMAKAHMEAFGTKRDHLAHVSVKNHYHASLNAKAQFPFEVSLPQVLASAPIADPLTLFDSSPISDGAAAVILSSDPKHARRGVTLSASAIATDTLSLADRKSMTELKATVLAGKKAYQQAGVESKDIDILEVHDCFTIAEILAIEDLGFCKKGDGGEFVKKGHTRIGGKIPVNTSGGLKACGHPIGATGVKQIVELTQQLTGTAGTKQVKDAKVGMCQNVGGTGATVAVHILKR